MPAPAALLHVLTEARALIRATPTLAAFAPLPDDDMPYQPSAPRALPVLGLLAPMRAQSAPATRALTGAILDAADLLHWQHSYSAAQVGTHYLNNYGWFNLTAPDGPFVADGLRISVGMWGQGLYYPEHRHAPEEVYCVLAGGALFRAEGRADRHAEPGDTVHHVSNQLHALDMSRTPLLAMALWKGQGLSDISTFPVRV